jgi:hypothetical protein
MLKKDPLSPRLILAAFVALNLILGLFIAPDFGISTDESPESARTGLALKMYTTKLDFNPEAAYTDLGLIQYYGTASTLIARAVQETLSPLFNLHPSAFTHYTYFVFFQIGVVAFFFLAANFMPEWSALLITSLFATQPLFFGHAFINPKDIPLMSVFLAVVAAGFRMVDRLARPTEDHTTALDAKQKRKQGRLLILLAVSLMIVFGKGWLHTLLPNFITHAYHAPDGALSKRIFQLFTSGGSLEGYLILAELAIFNLYKWIALLFLIVLLYCAYQVWQDRLFPGWLNPTVMLAGAVLGFAISTRILALAAWGMVGIYGLFALRKKGLPYLASYTLTAFAVSYLTWPYIWLFGVKGWLNSLRQFSEFSWVGSVLFEGQLYPQDALPARYLPKLMLLQFTEPVVILALAGAAVSVYLLAKKKVSPVKMGLVYAWFALPLAYSILADTINYNNFRQFLFITPPLFILAGLALHLIASRLNRKVLLGLLVILVLLPGLVALVQLHPYQYIYYNQFTGGVSGAYRQYELDYWLTSYKEVMGFLDERVPPGSRVLVWVNEQRLVTYAENEFKFVNHADKSEEDYPNYEYAVIPTIRFYDLKNLPDEKIIYQVERDDAVLAVVKRIK